MKLIIKLIICGLFGHSTIHVADEKGSRRFCDRCKTDFINQKSKEIIYKKLLNKKGS